MNVVSACLIGCKCTWKAGENNRDDPRFKGCLAICPEVFGGLSIPREPAEIHGDRVITRKGNDVTAEFKQGAEICLKMAKAAGAKKAYLKEKSPSCGVKQTYDGTFTKTLVEGSGVLAALLKDNGIEVIGIE